VTVIRQGLPYAPLPQLDAKPGGPPRLVVLGRLTPAKFVEQALETFLRARERLPGATLDVIGDGDAAYRATLQARAAAEAPGAVTFHGRVPAGEKLALLRHAHAHVFCSHREGWGLTVTEAAAMGTPTVGYRVPGVKDSVGDERLLAPRGDTAALAGRLVALLGDPALYAEVRETAWRDTLDRTYERTAATFAGALGLGL
jgi:glycosyltransferase involved in cell wall biosynthesis